MTEKAGRWSRIRVALLLALVLVASTAQGSFPARSLESSGLQAPATSSERALLVINPPAVQPGQGFGVDGFGFPPNQALDLVVSYSDGNSRPIGQVLADGVGRISGAAGEVPASLLSGSFTVVAQSTVGPDKFSASGYIIARVPSIAVSNNVGKAGDVVDFSGNGFAPQERVFAYLNGLGGEPFATFVADEWGNVNKAAATLPYGPTGENTLVIIGEQSKALATASFIVIGFFPTVTLSNFAPKGDEAVGFSGNSFGPNEQVRVHLNSLAAPPVKTIKSDAFGAFDESFGFDMPFGLKGKQTFIFVGESSGAAVPVDFEAAQYSPSIEPSTWAGRPGTTVTFYGNGFARNELVRVRRAATPARPAQEVSCFRTNENGEVGGLGAYTVQPTDEEGQLNLSLSTEKSLLTLSLSIQVLPAIGDLPPGSVRPNGGCDQMGSDQ